MITTFVPTACAGSWYFAGGGNPLASTLSPDSLGTIALLLSDCIILDQSWRYPYEEVGTETTDTACRVVDELISRELVRVVAPKKEISVDTELEYLKDGLWGFCHTYARCKKTNVSDDFKQLLLSNPTSAFYKITHQEDVPEVFDDPFAEDALRVILDTMFAALVAGELCNRVYDPRNYLGAYLNLTKEATEHSADEISAWAVRVCRQQVPTVPLYVTKAGYPARLRAPLEELGFTYSNPSHRGAADLSTTMKNLERIMTFRSSGVVEDLRGQYARLLKVVEAGNTEAAEFPETKKLDAQWKRAKSELRQRLQLSDTMEWWTDMLTVPAALVGAVVPVVAAIPLVYWGTAKLTAARARRGHKKEYPWYFFAEHVKPVAYEIAVKFPKQGERLVQDSGS